jgi:glycosyltransferase involved in cell wall biosynthesis
MTKPEISVITPCLNQEAYIRDAIESALRQDFPAFEHIVVDGGSTDGTLRTLSLFPHLRVVSEPDHGMYDAINKGLRMAKGEIIGLLNADDLYATDAFRLIAETLVRQPEALAICGGSDTFAGRLEDECIVTRVPPVDDRDFWQRMVDSPVTNAWFFRPAIFAQVGSFNASYRFIADRELFIRVAIAGIRPIPIYQTLYHYRQHSGSATISAEDSRTPKRGFQRIAVLTEDLQMLESFLDQRGIPPKARRAVRKSHSERAYRLTATAFYHHLHRQAAQAAGRGIRYDTLWPVIFLSMAARRLLKEFSAES